MITLLFGGQSKEHEISCRSAFNIAKQLDSLYDLQLVKIELDGKWKKCQIIENQFVEIDPATFDILLDTIVFPILHGTKGEDGRIQSLLDFIDVPYIGCSSTTSNLLFNKHLAKQITKVPVTPWILYDSSRKLEEIWVEASKWGSVFIKPSAEGSSFGVTQASSFADFKKGIDNALDFDDNILIEKDLSNYREIEVAVLETLEGWVISNCGEIVTGSNFYDYDSKYHSDEKNTIIPDDSYLFRNQLSIYCQQLIKEFKIEGLSRIDFFVGDSNIYLNEINTMPGFTDISMFPTLILNEGISYSQMINYLIKTARSKHGSS